ncbi:MAG TPA: SHOCT domain-containing protein [Baekduia sp.]
MGFLRRLTEMGGAQSAWRTGPEEKYAKILEIRHVLGPVSQIRLEIHFSNLPAREVLATVRIPRRVTPQVGQDVAYHVNGSGGGGGQVHYVIDWDKAPEYGGPIYDPQAAATEQIDRIMASGTVTTPAQAADPAYQLAMLTHRHEAGQISDAEFARAKEDLQRFAKDPARENDPAVQRARLEERHAAGEVSDAEYAERSRDIDNWIANLKRLQ